jgi:maltose alpha-D-glucosyltransferase/alpha-amylase
MSIDNSSAPLWYKDAIIYELHVKAFCDKNGDGIGDFRGLIDKLDYIKDLGVTAIWLLPFYPSPQKDDGTRTTAPCATSASSCARPTAAASR